MRSIEVPQWMFDAAVCRRMTLAATASVRIQSLRELHRLLCAVRRAEPSTVLKPDQPTQAEPGDDCATHQDAASVRSIETVSREADRSTLDGSAKGGSRTDVEAAGTTDSATSPRCSGTRSRKAGAR
jgi:hypothetical protein